MSAHQADNKIRSRDQKRDGSGGRCRIRFVRTGQMDVRVSILIAGGLGLVGWTIVVAAVAGYVSRQGREPVPPPPQPDLMKKLVEVEEELKQAKSQAEAAETERDGVEDQLADTKRQLARLETQLAALNRGRKPPPPTTKDPLGTDKDRLTDQKPVATRLGEERYAAKLPSRMGSLGNLQSSRTLLLNDLPADAEVRIRLPIDTQNDETQDGTIEVKPYRFVHEEGGLDIWYDYSDKFGHANSEKLAAAKIEKGNLWWDWLNTGVAIKKNDPPLDPLVRYSVLRVLSPAETTLREVQLTECKNLAFSLESDNEPSPHEWGSANPRLIVVSVPETWTVQPEEHRGLQKIKSPNEVELQVSIIGHPESDSDDDQIHIDWVSAKPSGARKPNRQLTPENLRKERADYQTYTMKRDDMIRYLEVSIEKKEKELGIPDLRALKEATEKRHKEADRNVAKLKRELHTLAPQLRTNETVLKNAREQLKKEREKGGSNIGRLERDVHNHQAELAKINTRDAVRQALAKIRKVEDIVKTIQRDLDGIQFDLEEKLDHKELLELRVRKASREDEKAERKKEWERFQREYNATKQEADTLAKQKQDVDSMTGTIRLEVQAEHSGARLGTIEITN